MTQLPLVLLHALLAAGPAAGLDPIVVTPNDEPLRVAVAVSARDGDPSTERALTQVLRQALDLSPPLLSTDEPGRADRFVRLAFERVGGGLRGLLTIRGADGVTATEERLEGSGSPRALALLAADRVRARELALPPVFQARLAAVRRLPGGGRELVTLDPLGGDVRTPRRDGLSVAAPRWHPDGRAILHTSWRGHPELWSLDPQTGQVSKVAALGTLASDAAPAPRGGAIAFSASVNGNADLYRLDPGRAVPVRLTDAPAADALPSWTPDGAELVFQSSRTGTAQLHAVPAVGGEARRLTLAPGSEYTEPAVHPLGDRVAAAVRERGTPFRIQVIPFSGERSSRDRVLETRLARVIASPAGCEGTEPAWSPEGELLAFTETCAGRTRVVVTTPDGVRRVELSVESLESAAWGPAPAR